MTLYAPPAGIDDFSRSQNSNAMQVGWHEKVAGFISNTKTGERPSNLFFDQFQDISGIPNSLPKGITWNAFPLFLQRWFSNKPRPEAERLAYVSAEQMVRKPVFSLFKKNQHGEFDALEIPYRRQDEYCEWHVSRVNGKILRISYTVEPPEYWEFLASHDFPLTLSLYRELLHSQEIEAEDLQWSHDVYSSEDGKKYELQYHKGDYNPWNVWNTEKGAVHLTHWANTLGAEVQLASDGTLGWPASAPGGGAVDPHALICCAGFGGVNRSSDPRIGAGVFGLASQGLSVALSDPIGLYMLPFQIPGLLDPRGNSIGDLALTFPRQSKDGTKVLRAEVAVPQAADYSLDQCTLDGKPFEFGGQVARLVTMALFGVAKKIPGKDISPIQTCPTFCCTYPGNPDFFGIFSRGKFGSCDKVTNKDWERALKDIPQETSPEVTDFLFVPGVGLTAEQSWKPSGRNLLPIR